MKREDVIPFYNNLHRKNLLCKFFIQIVISSSITQLTFIGLMCYNT